MPKVAHPRALLRSTPLRDRAAVQIAHPNPGNPSGEAPNTNHSHGCVFKNLVNCAFNSARLGRLLPFLALVSPEQLLELSVEEQLAINFRFSCLAATLTAHDSTLQLTRAIYVDRKLPLAASLLNTLPTTDGYRAPFQLVNSRVVATT